MQGLRQAAAPRHRPAAPSRRLRRVRSGSRQARARFAAAPRPACRVMFNAFVCGATRADGRIVDLAWQDHGGGTRSAPAPSSMPAARRRSRRACRRARRATATTARSISARSPRASAASRKRRHGVADQITAAMQAAKAAGADPSARIAACVTRLPLLGRRRLLSRLRGLRSARRAGQSAPRSRRGRQQAWAYLDVLRSLPGCAGAYLASTGLEFGTRESRHIEAVHRAGPAGRGRGPAYGRPASRSARAGVEWHDRATLQSQLHPIRPTRRPTKSRCAAPGEPRHRQPVRRRPSSSTPTARPAASPPRHGPPPSPPDRSCRRRAALLADPKGGQRARAAHPAGAGGADRHEPIRSPERCRTPWSKLRSWRRSSGPDAQPTAVFPAPSAATCSS